MAGVITRTSAKPSYPSNIQPSHEAIRALCAERLIDIGQSGIAVVDMIAAR
jgi:hypothetical protein